MNIYLRLDTLKLTVEEHAALFLLARDIRASRIHPQDADFEPPIPLDQFFNKA